MILEKEKKMIKIIAVISLIFLPGCITTYSEGSRTIRPAVHTHQHVYSPYWGPQTLYYMQHHGRRFVPRHGHRHRRVY